MTLISADNSLALAAVLIAMTGIGLAAEKTHFGKILSGPLIIMLLAMALSNLGIIPYTSPVFEMAAKSLVPLAIPLILMRADLKRIFRETGTMLMAFTAAVTLTIIGAYLAVTVVDLGEMEAQIVGAVAASYIGGSMNFVATANAVGIADSSVYIATLSADVVGALFFLMLLMMLPGLKIARRAMPSKFFAAEGGAVADTEEGIAHDETQGPFDAALALNGVAVSIIICLIAAEFAEMISASYMYILVITVLALVVANWGKRITGYVRHEFEIGTILMYTFFAAIGAGADIATVVTTALPTIVFIGILILVHLGLLLVVGRLLFQLARISKAKRP